MTLPKLSDLANVGLLLVPVIGLLGSDHIELQRQAVRIEENKHLYDEQLRQMFEQVRDMNTRTEKSFDDTKATMLRIEERINRVIERSK